MSLISREAVKVDCALSNAAVPCLKSKAYTRFTNHAHWSDAINTHLTFKAVFPDVELDVWTAPAIVLLFLPIPKTIARIS